MEARKYQNKVIRELLCNHRHGVKSQMVYAATGCGKTFIASKLIKRLAHIGLKTVFIVNSKELVSQSIRHLEMFGLSVGVLQAENTDWHPGDDVLVATVQSIKSRGLRFIPNLFIIDEAHNFWDGHKDLLQTFNALPYIGLSATPFTPGLGNHFQSLVKAPSIKQLTKDRHLVPVKAFAPSDEAVRKVLQSVDTTKSDFNKGELSKSMRTKELIGDLISTWQKHASHLQTFVFCCDIAHSDEVAQDFRNIGVTAHSITSETPEDERFSYVEQFKTGQVQVLTSVNVLSEGFDAPIATCGVLARPTLSRRVYMQQVGRLLRPFPNKEHALLLDHAANISRFGLPAEFDIESLSEEEMVRGKAKKKDRVLVACKECGFLNEPGYQTCEECGADRIPKRTKVTNTDDELVDVFDTNQPQEEWGADAKKTFYLELLYMVDEGVLPAKAPFRMYLERFDEKPLWSWRELPKIPPTEATMRYHRKKRRQYYLLQGLKKKSA